MSNKTETEFVKKEIELLREQFNKQQLSCISRIEALEKQNRELNVIITKLQNKIEKNKQAIAIFLSVSDSYENELDDDYVDDNVILD